jgi:prevent-host-death family protein
MSKARHMGMEEARARLAELLTAAEKGRETVITRYGRPVAKLMPAGAHDTPSAKRAPKRSKGSRRKR